MIPASSCRYDVSFAMFLAMDAELASRHERQGGVGPASLVPNQVGARLVEENASSPRADELPESVVRAIGRRVMRATARSRQSHHEFPRHSGSQGVEDVHRVRVAQDPERLARSPRAALEAPPKLLAQLLVPETAFSVVEHLLFEVRARLGRQIRVHFALGFVQPVRHEMGLESPAQVARDAESKQNKRSERDRREKDLP
jgi:hypothetical protein